MGGAALPDDACAQGLREPETLGGDLLLRGSFKGFRTLGDSL